MPFAKLFVFLVSIASLSACSTTYYLPKPPNIYTADAPYPHSDINPERQSADNKIIYVTDRIPVTKDGEKDFGSERSGKLRFGTADVVIGENKSWDDLVQAARSDVPRVKLEAKLSKITPKGSFPETPMKFTVSNGIVSLNPDAVAALSQSRNALTALIRDRMKTSHNRDVIVFIHGYNTSFDEAIFALNDIHHYSGRYGVPIAYTWPSDDGNLFGYFRDQGSADYTVYHLKEFLRTLMNMPDIRKIHVVAHSLGTQTTTSALRELLIETRAAGHSPLDKFKIENLIMAAPDLDYGVVTQRLVAEQFGTAFGRVTVYTNSRDRALSASNILHSGIRFGKLLPGQEDTRERDIFESVENVSFITVKGGSGGFFNHGYFTKNPATLSDIITLLTNPSDPGTQARPLLRRNGNFWEMDSDYLKTSKISSLLHGSAWSANQYPLLKESIYGNPS